MMPNMRTAMFGLEESLQFQIVKKVVTDHDLEESSKVIPVLWFEGVIQPLHPRDLLIKPEGQRQWKWWTLTTDIVLELDSVIKDVRGIEFRVMSLIDWQQAGFGIYQLVEGLGVE